ncbi:MAG TPA: PA0069 family radical SAM protein [Verrucomicrobiae bacterium]
MGTSLPPRRGAASNPPNRFQHISLERDEDWDPEQDPLPRTQFFRDRTATVITRNDSPDVGFEYTINPYRGCEHGCIYCYARPFHEFLGFSSGLDFETKIMVKEDAPELLRNELSSPKWKPTPIGMSGVTDCYQPIERRLKLTRRCLEVLVEFQNPVGIITKNSLVTRDLDLLTRLGVLQACVVFISLTTLDTELRAVMEPRTSPPAARLSTIRTLAQGGIPVGVLLGPTIPGLTDHEMPSLLEAAADAGARFAGYELLRLPHAVAPLFEDWLGRHFPLKQEKALNSIRAARGGELNDPKFGSRMRGTGKAADRISQMFHVACRKAGLAEDGPELSIAGFRKPAVRQLGLDL